MSETGELRLDLEEEPAYHVRFVLTSGSATPLGFAAVVYGMLITETSGSAAATVNIYDSADTSGTAQMQVKVASGATASINFPNRGVLFRNALTVNMGSGQARGSIFYRHYRR